MARVRADRDAPDGGDDVGVRGSPARSGRTAALAAAGSSATVDGDSPRRPAGLYQHVHLIDPRPRRSAHFSSSPCISRSAGRATRAITRGSLSARARSSRTSPSTCSTSATISTRRTGSSPSAPRGRCGLTGREPTADRHRTAAAPTSRYRNLAGLRQLRSPCARQRRRACGARFKGGLDEITSSAAVAHGSACMRASSTHCSSGCLAARRRWRRGDISGRNRGARARRARHAVTPRARRSGSRVGGLIVTQWRPARLPQRGGREHKQEWAVQGVKGRFAAD